MTRIGTLFLYLGATLGAVAASAVIDLTPDNFDKVVKSGKPSIVEFFAPWCGRK
jgi:protein disulfide-isomerase A6